MAKKEAKRRLLKLDLNSALKPKDVDLNSSKEVDGEMYYSLNDVEIIVQEVLAELSTDPTVGVTINPSETGVVLVCTPEDGDEYEVEVDLDTETLADENEAESEPVME